MSASRIHKILTYCIALVWLANGLFCKVLNLVPRHEQIVAKILGNEYSRLFTILIGLSEIAMAVWIVSGIKPRLNAIMQMLIVAVMNIMEFILVPGLLLWGRSNSVFALLLIVVIGFNEFGLNKRSPQQA
jgi:uncharacterized membrane protein YphA (DoxX/SURF4 family)